MWTNMLLTELAACFQPSALRKPAAYRRGPQKFQIIFRCLCGLASCPFGSLSLPRLSCEPPVTKGYLLPSPLLHASSEASNYPFIPMSLMCRLPLFRSVGALAAHEQQGTVCVTWGWRPPALLPTCTRPSPQSCSEFFCCACRTHSHFCANRSSAPHIRITYYYCSLSCGGARYVRCSCERG